MKGRIAIVTGSNRGIGKETALALAREGMTVVMGCRNTGSAAPACESICRDSGNPNVSVMQLDLTSKTSILSFVAGFKKKFGKLNVLVNNAGISTKRFEITAHGFESNIGTNYFGTFILTHHLLPLFEESGDDRIVNLSSDIYKIGSFKLDKLNTYRWFKAYAVSKYMVLLFTMELAERLRSRGITVNAVHPGVVATGIMFTGKWYDAVIRLIVGPFLIEPAEGAKTSAWIATSDDVKGVTGAYFIKKRPVVVPQKFNDPELRKKLWDESLKYV